MDCLIPINRRKVKDPLCNNGVASKCEGLYLFNHLSYFSVWFQERYGEVQAHTIVSLIK